MRRVHVEKEGSVSFDDEVTPSKLQHLTKSRPKFEGRKNTTKEAHRRNDEDNFGQLNGDTSHQNYQNNDFSFTSSPGSPKPLSLLHFGGKKGKENSKDLSGENKTNTGISTNCFSSNSPKDTSQLTHNSSKSKQTERLGFSYFNVTSSDKTSPIQHRNKKHEVGPPEVFKFEEKSQIKDIRQETNKTATRERNNPFKQFSPTISSGFSSNTNNNISGDVSKDNHAANRGNNPFNLTPRPKNKGTSDYDPESNWYNKPLSPQSTTAENNCNQIANVRPNTNYRNNEPLQHQTTKSSSSTTHSHSQVTSSTTKPSSSTTPTTKYTLLQSANMWTNTQSWQSNRPTSSTTFPSTTLKRDPQENDNIWENYQRSENHKPVTRAISTPDRVTDCHSSLKETNRTSNNKFYSSGRDEDLTRGRCGEKEALVIPIEEKNGENEDVEELSEKPKKNNAKNMRERLEQHTQNLKKGFSRMGSSMKSPNTNKNNNTQNDDKTSLINEADNLSEENRADKNEGKNNYGYVSTNNTTSTALPTKSGQNKGPIQRSFTWNSQRSSFKFINPSSKSKTKSESSTTSQVYQKTHSDVTDAPKKSPGDTSTSQSSRKENGKENKKGKITKENWLEKSGLSGLQFSKQTKNDKKYKQLGNKNNMYTSKEELLSEENEDDDREKSAVKKH